MVQYDNTDAVQKLWAFLSVLTWQLLLRQLNWVICPCRWCSFILAMKDKVQKWLFVKAGSVKCIPQYKSLFMLSLCSYSFIYDKHLWHSSPLRAPPTGCPLLSVSLTSFFFLVPGFGLDRKPRRGLPQQTHGGGKVPPSSPSASETPRGLWGSGTGS